MCDKKVISINSLQDVIRELRTIKMANYLSIFPQDDFLKEYINHIVQIFADIDFNKLNKQKEYFIIRAIMLYLERLTKRLPSRADNGFIHYFFNRNAKGSLYNHVCSIYNSIYVSEYFLEAININNILAEANETECLDLSYLSISSRDFDKILLFTKVKHLGIVELIVDGKFLSEHIKQHNFVVYNTLISYIYQLKELESIKLSGLYLNKKQLEDVLLRNLTDVLSSLENLAYLDLSDNFIDDESLECMLSMTDTDNIFSNSSKFNNLKMFVLAFNFLRFENYHKYKSKETKLFFRSLKERQIQLNLTCNNIHHFDPNTLEHKESDIFTIYSNIIFNANIKCESVLNSHYFIGEGQCLLAIGDNFDHEHAQIFAAFVDSKTQQCLMRYHLLEDRGRKGKAMIVMEDYNDEKHDLIDFIEEKNASLGFGKFYIRSIEKLKKMEETIRKDCDKNNFDKNLDLLHFSFSQDSINCYRYCLNIISQDIDTNLIQPILAIPRFDLTNKIPKKMSVLCFTMLNIIITSNIYSFKLQHTDKSLQMIK